MSLYAIGDLHLHFASPLKAGNQTKGIWRNHEERFRRICQDLIRPEDTLVLAGDHSWGRTLEEAMPDLEYIMRLPGRKVLLRGNHDMFWDAGKTEKLNRAFNGRLTFLQNNFVPYEDGALVGTKGYTFEGPFQVGYLGRIMSWDPEAKDHADLLVERESRRLRRSLDMARANGRAPIVLFLHYPPTSILEKDSIFTRMAASSGVRHVVYAHCHGEARFHDSLLGEHDGICYHLVSGDYLRWIPEKILP